MRRWPIGREKLAARTVTHLAKSIAECCLSITRRITCTLNSAANQVNSLALLLFRFWQKYLSTEPGGRPYLVESSIA